MAEDLPPVANARVYACLVYKNRIISFGRNEKKSHPIQRKFGGELKPYLHAETSCLIRARGRIETWELKRASIYICRVKRPSTWSREWVLGNAKPCPGCEKAIQYFGIRKVIYS